MATHIVWVRPDGSMCAGSLSEKPFIAKHYPLPEANRTVIIPFTKLRDRGISVTDINSATINSRVSEELETMVEVPADFKVDCSEGTLVFIGGMEEDRQECAIM